MLALREATTAAFSLNMARTIHIVAPLLSNTWRQWRAIGFFDFDAYKDEYRDMHDAGWSRCQPFSSPCRLRKASNVPTKKISYAAPVLQDFTGPGSFDAETTGGQSFTISGRGFGIEEGDVNIDSVFYKDSLSGEIFEALSCKVIVSDTEIVCRTVPGAGAALDVTVTIAGQSSLVDTIGYAKPKVIRIYPRVLDSKGGELITVYGENFGRAGIDTPSVVLSTPGGLRYEAASCNVTNTSSSIACRRSKESGPNS